MTNRIKEFNRIEVILHFLFWLILLYGIVWLTSITYFNSIEFNGKAITEIIVKSSYKLSLSILAFLLLIFYTNVFLLFHLSVFKNIFQRVIVTLLFSVFIYFGCYFLIDHFASGFKIEIPEWKHIQHNLWLIFTFVWGMSLSYYLSKEWYKNEILRKQMESLQVTTELNFLKSQINPHFLFNTLNNLFSMALEKQNDELANGISRLSGIMRYMIYESNSEMVSLEKEIDYIKSFIVLNKLRFDETEAMVNFLYPENSNGILVAPMLFIPFVENAFKYGVLIKEKSDINIIISLAENEILFSCENNDYSFIRKIDDDDITGIGLENVKRRLELLYKDSYSLEINSDNKKYLVVLKLFKK